MVAEQEQAAHVPPVRHSGRSVEIAVYRAGTRYHAVCLDLGLIVERPSADAALAELTALIHDYVEDAEREGRSWATTLRPVPYGERIYVYRRLLTAAATQFLRSLMLPGRGARSGPSRVEYIHQYRSV